MTAEEEQRLRILAYHFWLDEGMPEGRAAEHWAKAQRQLEIEFRLGFAGASDAAGLADTPAGRGVVTAQTNGTGSR
jgi:hypothetical protein